MNTVTVNIKAKEVAVNDLINRTPSQACNGRTASTQTVAETNESFRLAKIRQQKQLELQNNRND